jgi:BirA family biotin operon repressor/biotin-[acetyl-CoA-carboxylase] ligase
VLAAEVQRSGRGRMGRTWQAGVGRSLTFSMLWRFRRGAAELAGLSLAAGVAIVRALDALGAREAALKWPNDVLWRDRKLAGVLIEMQGDALGPSAAVIGIGLNVRLSKALRGRIDRPAADLESACGVSLDRNAVLGLIQSHLAGILEDFEEHGFAPLRGEWERHHAYQGQGIVLTLPTGQTEHGIARGVADDGALLFESGGALRPLHSGEISVRAEAADSRVGQRVRSGA